MFDDTLNGIHKSGGNGGGSGSLDEHAFSNLDEEFKKLKNDYLRFKDDTTGNFKNFGIQLDHKASKEELAHLEARIMDKLNELIKSLLLQFADKNETKKRFNLIEKNVRQIIV